MDFSQFNPLMIGAQQPVQPPVAQPVAPKTPEQAANPGLLQRWNAWMQNPVNRAAMMQTGLQMMQPMALGQTPAGHVGQAIGGGLEAGERVSKSQGEAAMAEREMAAKESNARASMIRAQREPTARDTLTAYQQTRLTAAEQAKFAKWLADNFYSTEDLNDPEKAKQILQEYQTFQGLAGRATGQTPSGQTAGPPPGALTATGPGGKKIWYDQGSDSWVGM